MTKAVGCADDIVRKFECGYVVKDKDPEELCYAIRDILRDPELAGRMGVKWNTCNEGEIQFRKDGAGVPLCDNAGVGGNSLQVAARSTSTTIALIDPI